MPTKPGKRPPRWRVDYWPTEGAGWIGTGDTLKEACVNLAKAVGIAAERIKEAVADTKVWTDDPD